MRLYRIVPILMITMSLTACSGFFSQSEVEELNNAEAIGSAFTQNLADEYRQFANSEQNEMFDYADALHFARKGLMAAEGNVVLPEPLDNWRLTTAAQSELSAQRDQLMTVLRNGARSNAPREAAKAQFNFDCWIEQQEEIWQSDDISECRDDYFNAMNDLGMAMEDLIRIDEDEDEITNDTVMISSDDMGMDNNVDSEELVPLADAMFLVFFDFDQSTVEASGTDIITAVADQINNRNDITNVVVTGHTDSAGNAAYNKRLSMRRANTVKDALIAAGVNADLIRVDGIGEDELMVSTPNNTREPTNRRAEIRFE